LKDILEYERPDKYIVSDTNYQKDGIPVLTANKSFILGYTKENFGIYNNLPAIIFDDFTANSKFVDFPFKVKSSAIKILRPIKKDNLRFIYELISQIKLDANEHKRYYISEYQKLSVPIPVIDEQQKIADCLCSLDDLIAAESQKLELLKEHKKGLMQRLFPQEGETRPQLRFPEFEKKGEWVERRLGEVFTSYSGGTPSASEKNYYGGNIPFIRSAEIGKNSTELFLTEKGLRNSSAKMVNKGDLLVALYGANSGEVAISQIEGAINQAVLCLKSEFSNSFTYHFLSHKRNWIVSTYIQGGQGNLSGEIIKSITLPFPTPCEQQKIADCLSSLDDLIAAQAEKIELLKLHKKGLMQRLFPKWSKL
jgi:type I restriction enzyme S subunit